MATCKDAVIAALRELGRASLKSEIIDCVYKNFPDKPWKPGTIQSYLIGLSINHPSGKHHPTYHRQACLFWDGNGKYSLIDPKQNQDIPDSLIEDEDILESVDSNEFFEATISLERDLEQYLIRDLNQIEDGLRLYSSKGISGQQFNTEVGRLDILAVDKNDDFVVIELKAGTANYTAIGQILGYTGWIKQNLSKGKKVRGIIIADDFDKRVKYASMDLTNITLKKYEVSFKIKDVKI